MRITVQVDVSTAIHRASDLYSVIDCIAAGGLPDRIAWRRPQFFLISRLLPAGTTALIDDHDHMKKKIVVNCGMEDVKLISGSHHE